MGSSTFAAKTSDQRVLFKQISLKCQVPTVVNSLPFCASMQYTQFHCNAPSCTCGRKLLERDSKASYRLRKTASVKLLTAQAFYPWTQPTLWYKARLGRCFCLYDWKDCSTCPSRKFHVAFVIEMHSILSKTWIQRFQIHKKALTQALLRSISCHEMSNLLIESQAGRISAGQWWESQNTNNGGRMQHLPQSRKWPECCWWCLESGSQAGEDVNARGHWYQPRSGQRLNDLLLWKPIAAQKASASKRLAMCGPKRQSCELSSAIHPHQGVVAAGMGMTWKPFSLPSSYLQRKGSHLCQNCWRARLTKTPVKPENHCLLVLVNAAL